ncbi:MAG: hypothetical protein KZQ66_12305 [Candidatus Thiodiazotropha sp. (ex Lucinoma aequizonata)]|nr:hypothetical protein [Candidatus Thiodiazotropha sp. (ex Lucinoma aequizonata)]MCU7888865.1 hypothetical protein [Candidatus Thiodiazotropha sp. (ex Lucinoma aequizonata)]MCU7895880.1 hypothetical protein [Candidatus Thiodiazotropha sp. (ex Lucinoma aequizonata)]MCU7898170.1 hypothetical protein [Candidatus Thiodiazotropha sp. (ex Lucinoma aequizonata)]MCU7902669.1 hypothetical protein [Candidatus Thiodiazotropha sp. (ex Lucinoma aequizonata)]
MATVKQLLAKIQKTHDQRTAAIKQIRKEQAALKKAGISYGSASYKQGKYSMKGKGDDGKLDQIIRLEVITNLSLWFYRQCLTR